MLRVVQGAVMAPLVAAATVRLQCCGPNLGPTSAGSGLSQGLGCRRNLNFL